MKKTLCLVAILMLLVPAQKLGAQERAGDGESNTAKEKKKKSDHNHQTFLKIGLVHTGSEIEGFNVAVNGLSIDLETYFNKNHLGFSGWFVGYRKDDIRRADLGHLLNSGIFREADVPVVDLKFGGGIEWGMPSLDFSKTRFGYEGGDLVYYEHLFLKHNSGVPKLGPSKDAVLYPFLELSVLKRWTWFLAEGGARWNLQKFGLDKYRLDGDDVTFVSSNRIRMVPALFIKIGTTLP